MDLLCAINTIPTMISIHPIITIKVLIKICFLMVIVNKHVNNSMCAKFNGKVFVNIQFIGMFEVTNTENLSNYAKFVQFDNNKDNDPVFTECKEEIE
jgi:hypothetical protein